jgi:hypothetical protein
MICLFRKFQVYAKASRDNKPRPPHWSAMASTNKCLAQMNKSRNGDDAT